MDEMPRLHPADPIDFFPNGSTQSEETSQPCSSSDEMPVGNFNGIPKIVSSPQRPLRLESDARQWNTKQLLKFLRVTFPDLNDVLNALQREKVSGSQLLSMSQQECIHSLGLNLGPALRLFEVIQELKSANESRS